MYLSKVKIYSIQIQVFCNLKKIELSISWALAPKEIKYIYQFFTQTCSCTYGPSSGTIEVTRPGQNNLHAFLLAGRGGEAKRFDYGYKPINNSVPTAFRMFVT